MCIQPTHSTGFSLCTGQYACLFHSVHCGVSFQFAANYLAVDIVLIFNEGLVTKVSELTSSDWFKSKNYILKTFPQDLAVKSWELAPGDSLQIPSSFFGTERVFSVMAFADYFSDGEHRVRIDQLRGGVILEFGIEDFSAFSITRK